MSHAAGGNSVLDWLAALDARLLAASRRTKALVLFATLLAIVAWSLPYVPRSLVDYSRVPILARLPQPDFYGPDTIADTYEARVVLNDVRDMYTKAKVAQTPREASTWTKAASSPYPPVTLLILAALHGIGLSMGVGLYGMVLVLAAVFIGLSLVYAVQTRWYVFPLLYLNCSYLAPRFVYVQDGSYLVMLVTILTALMLARARRSGAHLLMALAVTMKLSPAFYGATALRASRRIRAACLVIVLMGLALPALVWENYLYIYRYGSELRGDWTGWVSALAFVVPFTIALAYVQERRQFDWETRIGWSLVPVAFLLALKLNAARHLILVLLVPDKNAIRNLVVGVGLALYALFPSVVRLGSVVYIAAVLLSGVLLWHLRQIGWDIVSRELRSPFHTAKALFTGRES